MNPHASPYLKQPLLEPNSSQMIFLRLFLLVSTAVNSSIAPTDTDEFTIVQGFKAVLMFFSESFLSGAKIGEISLEGELSGVSSKILSRAIQNLFIHEPELSAKKNLSNFYLKLRGGIEISDLLLQLERSSSLSFESSEIIPKALMIQTCIKTYIDVNGGIIIPTGWIGHAIAIIIEKDRTVDTYKLIIANTGDGIQFHYNRPDPENIYPYLSKVWIEFSEIPTEEIFDQNSAWFICSLALMNNHDFTMNILKTLRSNSFLMSEPSFSTYFYGSILSNFREYLVVPKENDLDTKLVLQQLSGTCSMSSLLAALLYSSESLNDYYWYRIKIGQVMLEEFLNRVENIMSSSNPTKNENDLKFIEVLTDGLNYDGMKYFKSLMRGPAILLLKYLEFHFPDKFKYAGLPTSVNLAWIHEEKKNNSILFSKIENLILKIVSSAKRIHDITLKNKFRYETTHISKHHDSCNSQKGYFSISEYDFTILKSAAGSCAVETVKQIPDDRFKIYGEGQFVDFKDFFYTFKKFYDKSDFDKEVYFLRFLDIFHRLHSGSSWALITDHKTKDDLLQMQEMCKSLSVKFANLSNDSCYKENNLRKPSLDEITLLGHLQLLTWNIFKTLHEIIFPQTAVNWDTVIPPQSVQSMFLEYNKKEQRISGNANSWPIKGFNDMENYDLYKLFVKDGQSDLTTVSKNDTVISFPGPEMINASSGFNLNLVESFYKKFILNSLSFREIFNDFLKIDELRNIWDFNVWHRKYGFDWINMDRSYAMFIIFFFFEEKKLLLKIPHFYNLIYTLKSLMHGISSSGLTVQSNSFCFKIKETQTSYIFTSNLLGAYDVEKWRMKDKDNPLYKLSKNIITSDLFHLFRQVDACPEDVEVTDLDTWFNYVKNARSSKIFENSRFQYFTDHLLNIPKYKKGSHCIFLHFDEKLASNIIKELIRLVQIDVLKIIQEAHKLINSCSNSIIERAVNISIKTTRFISRVAYEFKDSDHDNWSCLLADLYNTFEPISALSVLRDNQISLINLALCYICSSNMSKPEIFMSSLNLGFSHSIMKNKEALSKFHWFITKTGYISQPNASISDDLFKYGFRGDPVKDHEIEFFEEVLKAKFLRNYYKSESMECSFQYLSCGYVIGISYEDTNLFLNLLTGMIVENGSVVISKSNFINSNEFKSFFNQKDQRYLIEYGRAIIYSGIPILVLPPLRGCSYFMIYNENNYFILRKWNDKLLIWRPKTCCNNLFVALNYNWTENSVHIFKTCQFDQNFVELSIFDEEAIDPFINITEECEDVFSGISIKISFPGLEQLLSSSTLESKTFNESHIKSFSEDGTTFATRENDGSTLVIFQKYRFIEQPSNPIVLIILLNGVISVANIENMNICIDQNIFKEKFSLSGSLIANVGDKTVLLLPNLDKNSSGYMNVERIPIITEYFESNNIYIPAPQTRKHKLLLAYYLIKAHHFDSARNLLYPRSIHQNEIFNVDEVKIITHITKYYCNNPEFITLKLFLMSHVLLNEAKFIFEINDEIKETFLTLKMEKENDILKLFNDHMMSIKDLSEKYHIHKVFPECLIKNSTLFKIFFLNNFSPPIKLKYAESFTSMYYNNYNLPEKIEYKFGQRINFDLLMSYIQDKDRLPSYKLLKFLLVRSSSEVIFNKSFEMALLCYISIPKFWRFFSVTCPGNLDSIMNYCSSSLSEMFEGINLSHMSKYTEAKDIVESLKKDLITTEIIPGYDNIGNSFRVVTDSEKDEIIGFQTEIIENLKATGSSNQKYSEIVFNPTIIESSKVLKSLSDSMKKFSSENSKPQATNFVIEAGSELALILGKLDTKLSHRIKLLLEQQKSLAQTLAYTAYENTNYDSITHTMEEIISIIHQRKQKKFENLYACYLRNSLSCIQKKFPQLSLEQSKNIQNESFIFYTQQVLLDYFEILQQRVQFFFDSSSLISVDDLYLFCDELDKISIFNERLQNPAILNFEFRSMKYRLKNEQVEDIKLLTNEDSIKDNFQSIVIQRMMAAGKTLVLGTISVVLKTLKRNDRLSILVPPSSLYQSNTTSMQTITYKYFKKTGNTFSFPRLPLRNYLENCSKILDFLDNIIIIMESTMKNRNYLILSPDHLHSFLNSYIEALTVLDEFYNDQNFIEIVQKYSKIYLIFKEKSSIILDEIDMTMDSKKELNFPTTEMEYYNSTAVAMIADVIEFLLFDEEIIELGLDIHSNNQAALNSEKYFECKTKILAYIEDQINLQNSVWNRLVPSLHANEAAEFLKNPSISYGKEWIEGLSDEGLRTLANALIIVKFLLNKNFESFLKGTVNQNYGSAGKLRPGIKYAVPYIAANTPSSGSVFADRWETLVKTLLMVSSSPCSMEIAKDVIKFIQKSIRLEEIMYPDLERKSLPTYTHTCLIISDRIEVLALDANLNHHVEMVHTGLFGRSPAAIRILFGYYISEVLSNMEFHVEQISSNALNMVSMFSSIQGYSGTIDNVMTLPQQVMLSAIEEHEKNEKNNGGIAMKLIQDFDDQIIPELNEDNFRKNVDEMVNEVFDSIEHSTENVSAFIDAGAFFKNFKNKQVAEAILKHCSHRIKTVIFYDEESNKLQFIFGTSTGYLETTDPEYIENATYSCIYERFTFYDQRHITGSDIPQPKFAHAIMTAGPRVLLRDILQGAMRMRSFMTSQKVNFLITPSVRSFYSSKVEVIKTNMHVSDLITLGSINEDEKQILENEKLAYGKIDAEIRSFLLDEISKNLTSSCCNIKNIITITKGNQNIFKRSLQEEPMDWLREKTLQTTVDLLDHHVNLRMANIEPFFKEELCFNLKDKLESMYKSYKETDSMYKSYKETDSMHKSYKETNSSFNTQNPVVDETKPFISDDSFINFLQPMGYGFSADTIGTEVLLQNSVQNLILKDLNLEALVNSTNYNHEVIKYDHNIVLEFEKNHNNIKLPTCIRNVVLSLNTLFNDLKESDKNLTESVLLTDGTRVGVTEDLVKIIEKFAFKYPIFSKYTLDGSHFLIISPKLELDKPIVILISAKHASRAFENINMLKNGSKNHYWLCNLFGDVKATTLESAFENVFLIPEFGMHISTLIFDLLVFNGSLMQILTEPILKRIYENVWLNHENSTNRAVFLRLRMKVLNEKDTKIFELDDKELINLNAKSLGDKTPELNDRSNPCLKSNTFIDMGIQNNFIKKYFSNSNQTLNDIKLDDSYKNISVFLREKESLTEEENYVDNNDDW